MEESPSGEVNWFSACQEIPRILWSPKAHYRIHKCLALVGYEAVCKNKHTVQFVPLYFNTVRSVHFWVNVFNLLYQLEPGALCSLKMVHLCRNMSLMRV